MDYTADFASISLISLSLSIDSELGRIGRILNMHVYQGSK